jgi:hypothetical protein
MGLRQDDRQGSIRHNEANPSGKSEPAEDSVSDSTPSRPPAKAMDQPQDAYKPDANPEKRTHCDYPRKAEQVIIRLTAA